MLCSFKVFIFITILVNVIVANSSLSQVYFAILSQTHSHHKKVGEKTKKNLEECLKENNLEENQILALHETPVKGGWTIFPLLPNIIRTARAGKT